MAFDRIFLMRSIILDDNYLFIITATQINKNLSITPTACMLYISLGLLGDLFFADTAYISQYILPPPHPMSSIALPDITSQLVLQDEHSVSIYHPRFVGLGSWLGRNPPTHSHSYSRIVLAF